VLLCWYETYQSKRHANTPPLTDINGFQAAEVRGIGSV
jgi:hypothetical protein